MREINSIIDFTEVILETRFEDWKDVCRRKVGGV